MLKCRHRWIVHRGESSDLSSLLYTVQRSHPFQIRTQLDVFLANNTREDSCNFHVSGSYYDQSLRVYRGDVLIAEVFIHFIMLNYALTLGSRIKVHLAGLMILLLLLVEEFFKKATYSRISKKYQICSKATL